jgi:ribosomal-protein-alanine N-acetyltransferase
MKYTLEGTETGRLIFRLLQPNDFETWLPLFEHPDTGRFVGMGHLKTAHEMCEKWFSIVFDRYQNNKGGLNVLVDKNTNEFIGQCGLLVQEVDGLQELEIGYSMLPVYWGKGYATEAAVKCREIAFERRYADSLISIIHRENLRSEKVARKNGMSLDKQTTFKDMPVNIFRINR